MANGITPLNRKYKKGSFYTFQSTGEDLTFTFNNSVNKFKFSKFALLEIPPIQDQTDGKNNIQFQNIEGQFIDGLSTASPAPEGDRIDLSHWIQNYMMNMETLLIRGENYNADNVQTSAERIFFKALKECGAIRYRAADSSEKAVSLSDDRFVEEDENDLPSGGNLYTPVVRYIGELDVDGSHKTNTNAFKEVYIYVPTQNGSTPTVMMKSIEDENYYAGQTIRKPLGDPNPEFIAGRDASDEPTAAGLNVGAYYDMDVPLTSLTYTVNGGSDPIWFDASAPNGPNAYFTDPVFGDPTNDNINRLNPANSEQIDYIRNRLDGVMIDWIPANYKKIVDDPIASNFNEFNTSAQSRSFRYNAVAIYYDIFDPAPDNMDENGQPIVTTTNLYGILFLNELEVISGGASQLGYLDKLKPNKIIGEQGNGYGIKMNFKFDVSSDSINEIDVEVTVDPYNTFSMELFINALHRILATNANMEKIIMDNLTLSQQIEELNALVLNDANKQELLIAIEEINVQLENVVPNKDLLDLINTNKDQIDSILLGKTTVDLNFILNLKTFDGLRLELVNNELIFSNKRQKYELVTEININESQNQITGIYNVLKNGEYTTLYYHKNGGVQKTAQDNIHIFISDEMNKWKNNQVMEIVFLDPIDMDGYGFVFLTDATNRFNLSAPYNKLIGTVPNVNSLNPSITIVCINSETYEFIIIQK